MNNKRAFYLFIAFLLSFSFSKNTEAQEDDGEYIYIYEYREPFFDIPVYIDTVVAEGNFSFTPEAGSTKCYYFNYGPYRSHFYARPGVEYIVELPDISKIDDDWKKDQYFTLLPHHASVNTGIRDKEIFDLNNAIRAFER